MPILVIGYQQTLSLIVIIPKFPLCPACNVLDTTFIFGIVVASIMEAFQSKQKQQNYSELKNTIDFKN